MEKYPLKITHDVSLQIVQILEPHRHKDYHYTLFEFLWDEDKQCQLLKFYFNEKLGMDKYHRYIENEDYRVGQMDLWSRVEDIGNDDPSYYHEDDDNDDDDEYFEDDDNDGPDLNDERR